MYLYYFDVYSKGENIYPGIQSFPPVIEWSKVNFYRCKDDCMGVSDGKRGEFHLFIFANLYLIFFGLNLVQKRNVFNTEIGSAQAYRDITFQFVNVKLHDTDASFDSYRIFVRQTAEFDEVCETPAMSIKLIMANCYIFCQPCLLDLLVITLLTPLKGSVFCGKLLHFCVPCLSDLLVITNTFERGFKGKTIAGVTSQFYHHSFIIAVTYIIAVISLQF